MIKSSKLYPTFAVVIIFLIWECVCRLFSIPDFVLPSPTTILKSFFNTELHIWLDHAWATTKTCLLGFFISFWLALSIAVAMTLSNKIKNTLFPLLVIIQSTPIVAIAPLLTVMFGSGETPRVIITILITFFPLVVSATSGLSNTPLEFIELSRTIGGSRFREYTQIRLPHAVPYILDGAKIAITLAIVGAVVAEFVAAENGLGYYIQFSTSYFSIPDAFAGLFLLAAISLLFFYIIVAIQKTFFPWSK
jgi:NitT/TauT family transport system permease protein